MSSVRAIRWARLLPGVTLAFAVVLSAVSYAKADAPAKDDLQEKITHDCRPLQSAPPGPTVKSDGKNGVMIGLKCDAEAKVELLAKTDQEQTVTLSNCTSPIVAPPAKADNSTKIKFQCDAYVTVKLPTTDSRGQPVTVKCGTSVNVDTPSPPDSSVTITPQCDADVKVELLAKAGQGEKITLNCGANSTVNRPTPSSVGITLTKCEVEVNVKVELGGQTQMTGECQPSAPVASARNTATISLKCDAGVKVEPLAKTDQKQTVTLDCNLTASAVQLALTDNLAMITLTRCISVVSVKLPTKPNHEHTVTVKCYPPSAKVDTPVPPNNSVMIKPKCDADMKVELLARNDQGAKVAGLKCGTPVSELAPNDTVMIALECDVTVEVELPTQTHLTLDCAPGAPGATYILDQQAKTVTYRNPDFRPEPADAKKCPQKRCDLGESDLIYCETWGAKFINNTVHWVRCGTDAWMPETNDEQKDEVTVDLQSGVMRQRFIGKAVKGMADRTWRCKVVTPKLITAKNAKEGPTVETSTTNKDGEVTNTVKVTTKKDSEPGQ